MTDQQFRAPMMKRFGPGEKIKTPQEAHEKFDKELAEMTRSIERKSNSVLPEGEPVRQGVAEELAKFIEQHADEMMKEAQQHRNDAFAYAKEIRDQTAEQLARLQAFTDSIKASQTEMAEVRMRFLRTGTTKDGGGVAKAPTENEGQG